MSSSMEHLSPSLFNFTSYEPYSSLWTDIRTLPAIHCLITGKSQDLYQAILENISANIPLFQPSLRCQTGNQHPELHFAMYIRK